MTIEEYNSKLKSLNDKFETDKEEIQIEYALSNNPHKVGDIIEDHYHTIQIERFKVYPGLGIPQCVYYGTELKKDGSPTKKQINFTMYQSNIKK